MRKYSEVEEFLFRQLPMFQRIGPKAFKKDLGNIKKLDSALGSRHKLFKSIHIAGTNGKGSVSFHVAAVLQMMGYKVGLYTSPHYKDYRERIKINGQMITKKYVVSFVNRLIEMDVFDSNLKPSFFEITVAMAFEYFADEQVDYAVIETGLGGRLDSTNVIKPVISVITNIGFDHTNFLGNTLPKIAKEKAGIIKKNVPVIIGRYQSEVYPVFQKIAEKKNAEIKLNKSRLSLDVMEGQPAYKVENMKTAHVALKKLKGKSITNELLNNAWSENLDEWGYMGRYQQLSDKPLVIADSAHNQAGLFVLFDHINKNVKYNNLHIVLAIVKDKEMDRVIDLFPKNATYYFSQARIPRAMDKDILAQHFENNGISGKVYSSIKRAMGAAKKKASQNDLVLITGSIFTVAEVI